MPACRVSPAKNARPKKAYATEDDAIATLGKNPTRTGMHAYRCERCGQWHVGHAKAQGRPRLVRKFERRKRRKNRKGAWA